MVDNLAIYVAQIRRLKQKFNYSARYIIAMDKTAVWSDMLAASTINKTGKIDIPLVLCLLSYQQIFFQPPIVILDSFNCYMTGSVREVLKGSILDTIIASAGYKAHIQAPDVSWNKPFKAHVTDEYEKWLSSGIHQYTNSRNMKAAPRR